MATAVGTAFLEFRDRIRTLQVPEGVIAQRQEMIAASLKKHVALTPPGLFVAGSIPRGTEIVPGATLDLFATLDFSRHRVLYKAEQPELVLHYVRDVLGEYLTEAAISLRPDGQAVTIGFDDLTFDLVPAFPKFGGAYMIPNAEVGVWTAADTRRYELIMARANAHLGGMLKPVVRMLKIWNQRHGCIFKGFHLEVIVLNALHTYYPDCNYASAVRQVFALLTFVMQYPTRDPAGVGDPVDRYLDIRDRRRLAITLAHDGWRTAEEAARLSRRPFSQRQAIACWREFFGDDYPAYG